MKLAIFDWDGTLVDSFAIINEALNAARSSFGLEAWSKEKLEHYLGLNSKVNFVDMFSSNAEKAKDIYYSSYVTLAKKHIKSLDGREELLNSLKDGGFTIGVISAKQDHILKDEIIGLNWQEIISTSVGSSRAKEDKPSAETYKTLIADLNLDSADVEDLYYIGDAPIDAIMASNINAKGLLVSGQTHSRDELEGFIADNSYSSCKVVEFNNLRDIIV